MTLFCVMAAGGCGEKKTYVLVHGAWNGAWVWDEVAAGLEAGGATVARVELPAHGVDTTAVSGATLDAYVGKTAAAIDAHSGMVHLVGHSMAGIVITATAEQRADRIGKLIYLAAYLPKDGETLQGLAMTDAGSHIGPAIMVDMTTGTAKLPQANLQDIFCADCSATAISTLKTRYRDEPIAPFATPVRSTAQNWGRVAKHYIYTRQDNAVSYGLQQTMTAGVAFESTATLETSHSPFLSRADLVISTLLGF